MEHAAFAMPVDVVGTAASPGECDTGDIESSSDCTILEGHAHKRARTSSDFDRKSGPLICAVIVSGPGGRWSLEFSGNDSPLRTALHREKGHFDMPSASASDNADSGIGGYTCHGVVALKSWELLDHCDNGVVASMVASIRRAHRRSKGIRFLRHRFIHAASLELPMPLDSVL